MDYRHSLDFLRSRGNEVQALHLGLHRMRSILAAFTDLYGDLPFLHIAGTNGKGSVAVFADSILRQMGHRTGLYTSPHLVSVRERIQVDGTAIHPASFARLMSALRVQEARLLRQGRLDRPLSYFELITAGMFLHFAESRVAAAVIEVGLGGALDATNVIQPRVSIITGISLDHCEFLGGTREKIASEKAGIIKPGRPVVSGCRGSGVRAVIRRRAHNQGSPLLELDEACRISVSDLRAGFYSIDLQTPRATYRGIRLGLAGEHQARNAALAVLGVETFLARGLPQAAVRSALARVRWPGRLDVYGCRRRTLLDGAHNPEGARALRLHLEKHAPPEIHIVLGLLRDKDANAIGRLLFPLARTIHLAAIRSPRSACPEELASLHQSFRTRLRLHRSAGEALRAAWRECSPSGLVVVTGSLYLLGELLPLVRRDARMRGVPGEGKRRRPQATRG